MRGHVPVMLDDVIDALSLGDGDIVVDGTFGGGGYARAILAAADCRLIGLDRDPGAILRAREMSLKVPRLDPVEGCFGDMEALVRGVGVSGVEAIVLDLGVSSFQLDEADRGFSFLRDGPLDMRMGSDGPSAADVVNGLAEQDLANVLFRLGDEPKSRRIARHVTARRTEVPFVRTLDLASVVEQALGGRRGARTHPATRTFQAIRMFVNDELGELARALTAGERLLQAGGRFVIVTFHSLEDRLVKTFFRRRAGAVGGGSRHRPAGDEGPVPTFRLNGRKPVSVSAAETARNPRARSAKLRLAVRTDAPAWTDAPEAAFGLPALATLRRRA